jgi:hypothetical protein
MVPVNVTGAIVVDAGWVIDVVVGAIVGVAIVGVAIVGVAIVGVAIVGVAIVGGATGGRVELVAAETTPAPAAWGCATCGPDPEQAPATRPTRVTKAAATAGRQIHMPPP